MGQGFAYARENNGTREVVIKDSTAKILQCPHLADI